MNPPTAVDHDLHPSTDPAAGVDVFAGLHVVDADAHFTEPPDLWSSRAPAALADRMPVLMNVEGRSGWYLDGQLWASTGGNTIQEGARKVLGSHVVQPFELVDPAAWSVPERLALMDQMGIRTQVIYPNGIGFASNHVFAITEPEVRTAVLQIYNDFYVELQEESGGRLLPQAILPIWDMDLTVAEMERLLDRGIRGFTLSDKPEMLGLPELPHSYFEPMWDLFDESGAVANFHIGAGARREEIERLRGARYVAQEDRGGARAEIPPVADTYWHSFGLQRQLAVQATQMPMSNVRVITNLCASNLFDRYPHLKVVSAESGIGWVPFALEALEFQLDEMVTEPDEAAYQQRRPTEYFRDHIYVMFWFEQHAPAHMIEKVGVNNVLVETDVPHPTCLYPGAREHFSKVMGGLDEHIRRRVLQDNAVELYRLDPETATA